MFLKTAIFFLRFSLPSTRKRRFPATKTQVFKNGLQKGDFSKRRLLVYVWKDENGVFFEDHDEIHHEILAIRMFCRGCYRISTVFLAFSCGRAKTI